MKRDSFKKIDAKKSDVKNVLSEEKTTASKGVSARKKTAVTKLKRRIKAIKRKVTRKVTKTSARVRKAKILPETVMPPSTEVPFITPYGEAMTREKEAIEVSKFTAVEAPKEHWYEYNLPIKYNDNRIVLLARDPWWVHAYWDIAESRITEVISSIPLHEREGLHWVLRVYDVTGVKHFTGTNGHSSFDIDIEVEVRNWYIHANNPGREWCVDIGFKNNKGKFFMVARSNTIKTPYFGISNVIDEEWALPDEEYYKALGVYDLGRSSMERKQRLEELIQYQVSSGAFSPGISSLFSAMGRKKERKFFLEVWTELILYGRTEPDAEVTVSGKKVKLRSDGTFSVRYALPEGNFEYKVKGTSSDKKETRTVTPAVKRYTKNTRK